MFPELRKKKRALSKEESIKVLIKGQEGILSTICENGYPYGVAVNFVYHNDCVYFHCANKGYKLDNIKNNNKVSFFVSTDIEIVPNEFTTRYSSVVVFGRATLVGREERREALIAIGEKYSKNFMEEGIKYIDKALDACSVVKIEIDHMTGKCSNKNN